MKTLYKALASVGMIALSTAAAFTIRHLAKRRKQNHDSANKAEADAQAQQIETKETQDDSVVTGETEIKPDTYSDSNDADATDDDGAADAEDVDTDDDADDAETAEIAEDEEKIEAADDAADADTVDNHDNVDE